MRCFEVLDLGITDVRCEVDCCEVRLNHKGTHAGHGWLGGREFYFTWDNDQFQPHVTYGPPRHEAVAEVVEVQEELAVPAA